MIITFFFGIRGLAQVRFADAECHFWWLLRFDHFAARSAPYLEMLARNATPSAPALRLPMMRRVGPKGLCVMASREAPKLGSTRMDIQVLNGCRPAVSYTLIRCFVHARIGTRRTPSAGRPLLKCPYLSWPGPGRLRDHARDNRPHQSKNWSFHRSVRGSWDS